jgi:tight adherence protein B
MRGSVIAAAVFLLVMVVILSVLAAASSRGREAERAMERLAQRPSWITRESLSRKRLTEEGGLYRVLIGRFNLIQRLEQNMWQAGIYMRVSEMLLVIVLLFGTGEVIGAAFLGQSSLALAVGAGLALLPLLYVRFRRARRLKQFAEQLPYALDLVKSLLEAGHSLLRGFQVVVKEFRDPIATEFSAVLEQASLGLPLALALEEMLKRVPQDDLRLLVVAVKVQARAGSSLAQVIGRLSEIMRNRQRLQAQIRALTAQSRMSGIIVGVLPIVVLGAFSLIQPGYASALFYDPTGIKMLRAAVILDLMAIITIRYMLKVEY